jgi:acetylornithine deacetylase/succinyl-diaminopimelate desuccinylase-like protein
VLSATADEEVGSGYGLGWLCAEHPELVRAAWCVNEGGGDRIEVGGACLYLCATSEKVTAPFVLRVRGRSGHASLPGLGENALLKAASALTAIAKLEPPLALTPETAAFFRAVVGEAQDASRALAELRGFAPRTASMLEPMLGATVTPTQIWASSSRNVIPSVCEIGFDCRLLPGQSAEEAERLVREAVAPDDVEIEWSERLGGSRSATATPLWDAIQAFVDREDPGGTLVPVLLPGFTDSHCLRERFGTVAYGFFPMRTMDAAVAAELVHSADERAAVDDLELGTRFLLHVARELLS